MKLLENAKKSCIELQEMNQSDISKILEDYSNLLVKNIKEIVKENQKDLKKMNVNDPKYDRLLLNEQRIKSIAHDVQNIANLKFNSYKLIEKYKAKSGIEIQKMSVPIGVVGIIYESRPNVTIDAISICLKTQNVCVLKGAPEADFSNQILVKIAKQVFKKHKLNENVVVLLKPDVDSTKMLIQADKYIDVCIPRGGQGLINFVRDNAKVPVIETGAGVVHIYVDKSANIKKAQDVIFNAKTRRPSVCNSVDGIIIHKAMLNKLDQIIKPIIEKNTIIHADEESYKVLNKKVPAKLLKKANKKHFGMEFLSLQISIKTVTSGDEAIDHIQKHTSKHSECIITEDKKVAEKFCKIIDSAVVYVNTSTAFTDGGEFGMAAEIGISTQKLHARGPFALNELTTYKWIVNSDGKIR